MQQQDNGIFTISLDFELYWGIFEKTKLEERLEYFKNTRKVIPQLLQLFNKYNVHVTWAAVGMLFAHNWDEWDELNPITKPTYIKQAVNPYRLKEIYGQKKDLEYCFFAPDLIKQITQTENQELGTHTYSHYFCQEPGQDISAFDADLKIARALINKLNINLKSLVFPRNQIREDYLKTCTENGIKIVRSNPDDWFWEETLKETLAKKIFRTGDAFIQLGKAKYYKEDNIKQHNELPIQMPASRFLRPYCNKNILNKLRLQRILREMECAAKSKSIYHLWWHPHNFGFYPAQSLFDLEIILKKYDELKSKYNFSSLNMGEIQITRDNDL